MRRKNFGYYAISFGILFLICISIFLMPLNIQMANAESVDSASFKQSEQYSENKDLELNYNQEEVVEAETSLSNMETSVKSFLEKNETSVLSELYGQKEYYDNLLNSSNNELEKKNIQLIINTTSELISLSENNGIATLQNSRLSAGTGALVSTCLAAFNFFGYHLSAELLTYMASNTNQNAEYIPIHGYRVMSSDITYDIALGEKTYDVDNKACFEQDGTVNGNDLANSIHEFNFWENSPQSRIVTITDTYDFKREDNQYFALKQEVVNALADAQNAGELIPYNVKIVLDAGAYLRVENVDEYRIGDQQAGWKIKITNYDTVATYAIFNTKMCNPEDAINWQALTNISYAYLPANGGSTEVVITNNFFATHIAVSRIKGSIRYITYGDNLQLSSGLSPYLARKVCNNNGAVNLIGDAGTHWIVQVKNIFSGTMMVEYNSKMCYEEDARSWSGLVDLKRFNLAKGSTRIITINKNFNATCIAISFQNGSRRYIRYADNLNADCTLDIHNNTLYPNLQVSIVSKSGNTWYIKITNPTDASLNVSYNTKMCHKGDAENWTNLVDIANITIPSKGSRTVAITENWFATSIAVSYVVDGTRVITFADGLNVNGNINVMYKK